ncbi:hypothetical protein [Snodgrassella sp. CFCC 13594]|uniref:hypothetical protein n=1 Tax=Snodgrassella sp. CFCC 13594 TaxID=1775559 RepID=UPI000AEB25AD|nr:hypothetical protein [Snodgrassella sp. CFCC 13594]
MVIAYPVMEIENPIKNTAQTRRLCSYPPLPESNPHLVGSMNTPLLSLWHVPAAKLFTKQRQPPLDGRIHRNRTNIVVGSCAMATIKGLAFISDILNHYGIGYGVTCTEIPFSNELLIGCCCCMYCVTRENCIYCVSAQSQSHASTITPYRKPSSGASHLSFYTVRNDNHHTSQSIDQATKNRR